MIQTEEAPRTRRKAAGEQWASAVREDHRQLREQAGVLESALAIDTTDLDRRVVLSWTLRNLWAKLELHLRKEEEALFSSLERLIGGDSGTLAILREEHAGLRAAFRNLAELLQDPTHLEWDRIVLAVEGLLYLLDEHDKLGERLLLDVLHYSLNHHEQEALAEAYRAVARKAREEEGWPAPSWNRPTA